MKEKTPIVTVQQPWATAAVFGTTDVINQVMRDRSTGWFFLATSRRVDRSATCNERLMATLVPYAAGSYAGLLNTVIGAVKITGCVRPWECQLPHAKGPWCMLIGGSVVFMRPFELMAGTDRYDTESLDNALEDASSDSLTPDRALAVLSKRALIQTLDQADPDMLD